METRILLVEDEAAIREMVAISLKHEGFAIEEAGTTTEADGALGRSLPDLMLLDWMLPGTSGLEYARRLRHDESTRDLPIILLTAKSEENDKLAGFDAGVDDYIAKPFSIRELIARIRAVLKRVRGFDLDEILRIQELALDPVSHRLSVDSEPVKIGPTEFRLLQFFMSNADRVYSRSQLLDRVWGTNVYVEERTVDVHIRRLRKLLKPYNFDHYIQTVHGMGYRFSKSAS